MMDFLRSLRPSQPQNQFKIELRDMDWEDKWPEVISSQTTKIEMDFVHKRVSVFIEQLQAGTIQEIIFHILQKQTRKIDMIRVWPSKKHIGTKGYEYEFRNGILVDHHTEFDYKKGDAVVHQLDFEFNSLSLKSGPKDKPHVISVGDPLDDTVDELLSQEKTILHS